MTTQKKKEKKEKKKHHQNTTIITEPVRGLKKIYIGTKRLFQQKCLIFFFKKIPPS